MKLVVSTCIVFLFTFSLYLFMCSPTVTSDDSGELSGVCSTLGIAHPSGYPLYSIIGKIVNTIFVFANSAYRTNLISVIFGGLTMAGTFCTILILSKNLDCFNILLSFFSVLILAFSKHFLSMSICTEVYTLNSFLALVILFFMFYPEINFEKRFYFVSFISGFSLGDHQTIVLIFPAIFLWLVLNYKEINLSFKKVLIALFFFLLGFSIYIYIPIRSLKEPLFDWEDPQTFKRFFNLVKRARYGGHIAQGKPFPITFSFIAEETKLFIDIISEGITLTGLIIFTVLLILSLKNKFRLTSILFAFLIFSGPLFFVMARMQPTEQSKALLERFVYLPMVPIGLIIGIGAENLYQKNKIFGKALLLILLFLSIFIANKNFSELNRRKDFTFYDYGKNILRTLPENSIVFFDRADEMEFVVGYLTRVEKFRKDIEFIDCNAGVSKSIYGDDYYEIWGKPRLEIREKVERQIIEKADRPVFYATFLPEQINIPRVRYGIIHKVIGNKKDIPEKFDWSQLYTLREPIESDIRSKSLYQTHFSLLGNYFLEKDEIDKAKENFETLAIITKNPEALLIIPYYYFQKGDYKKAIAEYEELLKIKPGWLDVLLNLGVLYEKLENFDLAEKYYRKVMEIKPDYPRVYYNMAVLEWKRQNWNEVIKMFEKFLSLEPENSEAKYYLSIAERKIKK